MGRGAAQVIEPKVSSATTHSKSKLIRNEAASIMNPYSPIDVDLTQFLYTGKLIAYAITINS